MLQYIVVILLHVFLLTVKSQINMANDLGNRRLAYIEPSLGTSLCEITITVYYIY